MAGAGARALEADSDPGSALAAEGEGPQELQAAGLGKPVAVRAGWESEERPVPAYICPKPRTHRTLCILRTP